MNGIIAVNWDMTKPHWTPAYTPFEPGFGLVLVEAKNVLVAFSVYRRLSIAGQLALYQSGTEVLPAYQGQGLYGFLIAETLAAAAEDGTYSEILYGWRTRNPIIWASNAKLCTVIAPSLLDLAPDLDLQTAGVAMAQIVHPERALELPGMIMRGAYDHITHKPQFYTGTAALVQATMQRLIPDPADALFSIGRIRP